MILGTLPGLVKNHNLQPKDIVFNGSSGGESVYVITQIESTKGESETIRTVNKVKGKDLVSGGYNPPEVELSLVKEWQVERQVDKSGRLKLVHRGKYTKIVSQF